MKDLARVGLSATLLLFAGIASAFAQNAEDEFFRQWVEYRDGAVSVAFTQVPVEFAVHAIRARTGFQIVVPREAYGKRLSLSLRELPLESAMRSVIFSIGFTSFAFTYDGNGRPVRAIILEARPDRGSETAPADKAASGTRPLTTAEKEELSASLKIWNELTDEARWRLEERLRSLPPSDDREEMLKEYGRRILSAKLGG